MHAHHDYAILGKNLTATTWDGSPTTLKPNDSVAMPQTPNGSTVMAYQNMATTNASGQIGLTSGGSVPQFYTVPALANQPSILVQNWGGNNLSITNTTFQAAVPIWVEMFGPGIPGAPTPAAIVNGTPLSVASGKTAAGQASPNYMQFIVQSNTANLTIVTLIGGPPTVSGNNAYVFAVNFPDNGDKTGYTQVTGGNTLMFPFNWGGSSFYVANMSANNAAAATIVVRSL